MTDPTAVGQTADYIKALAAPFVAGFAVQQGVEVVSSLYSLKEKWDKNVKGKKAFFSFVSVVLAWMIVALADLDVLKPFIQGESNAFIHRFTTIIFLSAGTEGFNSVMKWLSYKKADVKATVAEKAKTAASAMSAVAS